MNPTLALLSGFAFIGWMLARDGRWRQLPSRALWIPGIWLALTSSRQLSFWLAQAGVGGGGSSNLEGSPVNVIFNGSLFLIAILVLARRRFSWARYALENKALFAIYAFYLCSMLWSPFPVPTMKRVVQEFGHVLIAAVVLTERDPAASMRVVFVRVSYVLFPLSVIFIRYFPDIGRNVSYVSGAHMLCGVADHKNSLGQLAMVFCLVLLWDLMETRKDATAPGIKPDRWFRLVNCGIGLYLLFVSDSATAVICFLLGVALLFAGKRLAVMKHANQVFMLNVLALVLLLALEQMYGVVGRVSESLDRGTGLTGRTEIWQVILEKNTGYVVGAGFRGFWETREGESVSEELGTNALITAHNGYLETYLNGGVVALVLLGAFIWTTGLNATSMLVKGSQIGRLAVMFWPILLVNNVTESQFFQSGPLWFAALLVTMDSPWQDRHEHDADVRAAHHTRRGSQRSIRSA